MHGAALAIATFAGGVVVLLLLARIAGWLVGNLQPFDADEPRRREPIPPIIDPMGSPSEEE
jgi:hypothetical protein